LLLRDGAILGITPKVYAPSLQESQQSRWFSFENKVNPLPESIMLFGLDVPVGPIVFTDQVNGVSLALEVSTDLFHPISPGKLLALSGAHIILNCGSFPAQIGNEDKLLHAVTSVSKTCNCGYAVASCGVQESTGDHVYAGENMFAQLDEVIPSRNRFSKELNIQYFDMDYATIKHMQTRNHYEDLNSLAFSPQKVVLGKIKTVNVSKEGLLHFYRRTPYLPLNMDEYDRACEEVFNIQVAGLVKRLAHTHSSCSVLGISGGLDSTLALLVACEAAKVLGMSPTQVLTITMPGFGTSDQTYANALNIMKALGTDLREISIKDSVLSHFKDIGHDVNVHDVTYENVQARERTEILMNLANKEGGLVIGTGDLSELALGWCTY
ncbi:MAG: NAD(+) synthase, partial [Anaerovorax sp.]